MNNLINKFQRLIKIARKIMKKIKVQEIGIKCYVGKKCK